MSKETLSNALKDRQLENEEIKKEIAEVSQMKER